MGGCLNEVEIFQAFRGEMAADELTASLHHVLGCPLCHEQWKHFALDEQVADGIRSAVLGDVKAADTTPGVSDAMDIPDKLAIPGFRLRGDYIEGGQARVYRAVHEASQEEVAIKVFYNSPLNEGGYSRFSRELQSLARLRHSHVIPIRSAGEILGHAYYVMPWIEGLPLNEHIKHHRPTIKERVGLLIKVCSAVDHAHKRGVMHLDLKPSNVRVDRQGEPIVLDFGLARLSSGDQTDLAELGLGVAGTPAYMAPEQVNDSEDVDTRADVFMLGLLLHEVLTGKRARREVRGGQHVGLELALEAPPPIRRVDSSVGRELAAIVDTATQAERGARYQTTEALLTDLTSFVNGTAVQAMGDSVLYRISKFSRRYVAVVTGVACVTSILVVAMLVNREYQHVAEESLLWASKWESATVRLKDRNVHDLREELANALDEIAADIEAIPGQNYAAKARSYRARAEEQRRQNLIQQGFLETESGKAPSE